MRRTLRCSEILMFKKYAPNRRECDCLSVTDACRKRAVEDLPTCRCLPGSLVKTAHYLKRRVLPLWPLYEMPPFALSNSGRIAIPYPVCERIGSDKQAVRAQAFKMRYFFHLEDGSCIFDPKGTDFQDDAAAMLEATNVARELSKLPIYQHDWCVVVKNADGIRVGSVPLTPSLEGTAHGDPAPSRSVH